MATRVVVLGAGFGGLELSKRLSDALPDRVQVTLIDQSDCFVFGFSKLDVLFGHRPLGQCQAHYGDVKFPGVTFRQETILAIDPDSRRVETNVGIYDADILVVALGADLDPAATPGFAGLGEFYSPPGAERLAGTVRSFTSGRAVVAVLGPFFKCPPAPYETAFMLHDHLVRHGLRADSEVCVVAPQPMPIPISQEVSGAIMSAMDDRDIEYRPKRTVTKIDPDERVAHLDDGSTLPFDLFLGIPIHRAPAVVVESGMTDDGWIAVDPATFATKYPNVYAVGDVTSVPVPRAGVIAEGEAATLADVLIAELTGGPPPPPYPGSAVCYIEMGERQVARVDVNFLSGPVPTAAFRPPSLAGADEKRQFAATRLARWFGYDEPGGVHR
jgi:sulfide:quinone oxidoreductase